MMKNKIVFCLLTAMVLASVPVAQAQQEKKVPRIGFLAAGSFSSSAENLEILRRGLHKLGYVEQKNIVVEYRFGEGEFDKLLPLAAELVRLKVDVLVAQATPGALAAKKATASIPIVFVAVADPIGSGVVASLARPEGNITGFSTMNAGLSAKRLELLKEAFPKISRVAVLLQPDAHGETTTTNMLKEAEDTAQLLGLHLQVLKVRGVADIDKAFSAMTKERATALVVFPRPGVVAERKRIVDQAAQYRLPAMYPTSPYVEIGGIMSYAANFSEQFYRAATYVDKILKGAKPADLPVEQPKKFELVINLKAAKQIGLTIPPNVLARADKVIR
jgi:putative tryptophan/tyrosine transport system substrate-binding protein